MRETNKYKLLSATVICLVCLSAAVSQAQVLPDLQKNFAAYQAGNFREKIFVHTDKSFYLTGEIAWFKIYCTEGSTNKLLDVSKVAYVELLDDNGTAVMQAKVALENGMGNGSLNLPFSVNSGNYRLRAYTSWMKNFDVAYFFEKQITIVNPLKAPATAANPAAPGYDIQFFPEGGRLVAGLSSKVAFKVTGADGKGLGCTGAVVGPGGDTVARFESVKFGMGSFVFTPAANEQYKAIIRVNSGMVTKDLPAASASGYVLRVIDSGERYEVHITVAGDLASSAVYTIVHNQNTIELAEASRLQNGSARFSVNKNKLQDGISFITLFDDQKRPLCERMIFRRPIKKLMIDARTDQPGYDARKKVEVSISTRNEKNANVPANLSVSVFRADNLQDMNPVHIAGWLWLRADVKGYIESPDYYLENTGREADAALDNLMLSQGWTQFDRTRTAASPKLTFLPEYTGQIVTGHITNTLTNTPGKNITAYLTIHGKPDQLYVAKSDSAGRLIFNTQRFFGPHEMVVQPDWQQDSTYRVEISSPFSDQHSAAAIKPTAFTPGDTAKVALASNSLNMQVQNIFSANQLKQFYAPQADTTMFYGKPGKAYKLDDYTRFTTMEEVLREYVTSIAVAKRQGKFGIRMFNVDKPLGAPLILLDGTPVFDADKLFKMDPLKIRRLEMVTVNYLYGPAVFHGIMSFSTYKGDGDSFSIDPRAVVLDYDGLQLERKFYSPLYDSDEQRNSPIPDFRTTLYWNPRVSAAQDGSAGLMFYTGDKPGRYVGIIEGISGNGEAGSGYFNFEIKK